MNKTACVFGGSGFLGSHVSEQLCKAGVRVRIFDKARSPWLRPGQEMIVGDILNESEVDDAIDGCDVVYNFAALSDLDEGLKRPLDTVRLNVLGNVHILEACRRFRVERFVYASTVYVYSRQGGFYRCSKQAAEQYVEEYQRLYGLNYTILRYGSLYGPRADENNGIYKIIKKALDTGVIYYEGSVEATREYIHVHDAARASVVALESEFMNQSVVLTGQQRMRVFDLLKMLAEILGADTEVEFVDSQHEGHYVRTPYAYQPKLGVKYVPPMYVDLGQGLIQLIDEIKSSLDGKT